MRKSQRLLTIVVLSVAVLSIPAFAGGSAVTTVTIQVDGLSCPFCTYGLEKNLKKVNAVKSVDIDMKRGRATVVIRQGMDVADDVLRQAVKKAGFTARDITYR